MHKKKIIVTLLSILILFILASNFSRKKTVSVEEIPKKPLTVSVQSVSESKTITQKRSFPASIVSDQEVKITAKIAGTVTIAPGALGEKIFKGSLLARIDDLGAQAIGNQGLRNLQVQQSSLSVEQAKKSYNLTKQTYDDLKKSSSATSIQKDTAKTQRDIAKLQYESAILGLNGTIDNHSVLSPLSGTITSRAVSVGDSVSVGQLIATVSQSSTVKVQFFVDAEERSALTRGQEISAIDTAGTSFPLVIKNIAITADPVTRHFLVEAYPKKQDASLLAGTITTVSFETIIRPKTENALLLPLSALSISQNESSLFIVENNTAKKEVITIQNISGENAEVLSHIPSESLIIIEGSKLVTDGQPVVVKN